MPRAKTPRSAETELLVRSRRWCALCFGLSLDEGPKKGQIAHVDRDASNSEGTNLCWLCLPHHDEYDSRPSQSKGFTPAELRRHRDNLYHFLDRQLALLTLPLQVSLSPSALVVAEQFVLGSLNGRRIDPQIRIDSFPTTLSMTEDDVQMALDELRERNLVEFNGFGDIAFPTYRLFWELDQFFCDNDPSSDATTVAQTIVRHSLPAISIDELAGVLGWDARRLNPATMYLAESGKIEATAMLTGKFWTNELRRTTATKRLVRDLNQSEQ